MTDVFADLRYALRQMWKNPAFSAIALAALALGIGANIAIFTVVDAVMLSPLPYPEPDRLVQVSRKFRNGTGNSTSIPKFMAWRHNDAFSAIALYDFGALSMTLGTSTPPDQIKVTHVSGGYFDVFGAKPLRGRFFTADEDAPKGPAAAVISYGLWQSRFGGDSAIATRSVQLNGMSYPIVGVLPQGFTTNPEADAFIPLQADPGSTNQGHYLSVAARLKPGATLALAQSQASARGEEYRNAFPKNMDKTEGVAVVPLRQAMVGDVRVALLILTGAVGLVLLIACANVANLLLVRASVRQRELSIRTAVGASRFRVIRQLLTESFLLSGMGAALGFALGAWGVRVLLTLVPGNIPRLTSENGAKPALPVLDPNVVLFTIGLSVLTGLIFGLLPALHASRTNVASNLKESGGRSGTGMRQNRVRSVLVISEIALAVVLLIGAGLLIRTFVGLQNAKTGIDAHNILTLSTSLTGSGYTSTAKVDHLSEQAVRRIETLPGVEAAASMIMLPIEGGVDLPFSIVGKTPARGDYEGDEQWRSISPHYFQVFRIPLLRGRTFNEADTANSSHVVLINEYMAKRYFKDSDPVGQLILIGKGLGPQFDDPPRQIVGIVGTVRENGMKRGDAGVMYIPQSQVPEGLTALANSVIPLSWAVRTATTPFTLKFALERELRTIDGQLPIARERTMEQVIEQNVARQNFNMLLLSVFAGIALVLAAIGIYGLMAYTVQQRTQEYGIRMALGASTGHLRNRTLWHGAKLALFGVIVGLGLAYALTRVLASLLFGVSSGDPLVFSAVAFTLALIALIATYLPALRATAVDPVIALRAE